MKMMKVLRLYKICINIFHIEPSKVKLESDVYNVCSLTSGAETAALTDATVMMWL